MRSKFTALLVGLLLFSIAVTQTLAEEGMWMLDELNVLPFDQMKAKGLELSAEQIYNLKDAVVQIGGGSGAFVSPNGLILTNHHVAFGAIQQGSTLEQNFIQNGFLAKTQKEELHATGYQVLITKDFKDVTREALKGISEKMSNFDRYKAIEKNQKKLIAECEKGGKTRCSVVEVLSGTKYYLFTYDRIKDVRLVYAPPSSIGSFGGDIDNWMWPRHAGDFSFFRAYVGPDGSPAEYSEKNVPYQPSKYLPISLKGYKEGSYTMIMGYPGNTFRYRDSYSIDMWQNHLYPFQIETAKEELKLLNAKSEENPELAIKFADRIAGISNGFKNNEGMLEGLKKTRLLERKLKQEAEFKQFLAQHPDLEKKYGDVLPAIGKVYADLKTYSDKQNVLDGQTSDVLGFAYILQKWSAEKIKKDMDREPQYQDRNIPDLKDYLKEAQHDLDIPTDQLLLEMFLTRASNLPEGQKVEVVEKVVLGKQGEEKKKAVQQFVQNLYANTRVGDLDERLKMFDMTADELKKQNDAMINFAAELEKERTVIDDRYKAFVGAVYQLRPVYIRGISEWKKQALYPDANGTLRFNWGVIKGYSPRDAVYYDYVTTLKGVMEKDTGEDPFKVPEALKNLYASKDFGRYADPTRGVMLVDFLSTNDGTGGNSGSPIMNGKGEIIGLIFDGDYESMTSDFQYDPNLTRAINVDSRYILFITEKMGQANNILKELDIR
jgi:hypothetical protein